MKKGIFITFEGVDGSGKSTVLQNITERLKEDGFNNFILTREPGGSKISEQIRKIILDKDNKEEDLKTEALLYAASRRQHLVEIVEKALNESKLVLSDRYIDSSLVYQGYARGIGIEEVLKINEFAIDGRYPDLTFLFDLKPEIGLQRIQKGRNDKTDRLDEEKLSFHQKVYEGYKIIEKMFKDRIFTVDASKDIDTVTSSVYNKLTSFIKQHD